MGEAKRRKERAEELISGRAHRQEIFRRARRATVAFGLLNTTAQEKPRVIGSGLLVDTKAGLVLTARHVIQDLQALQMKEQQIGRTVQGMVFVPGSEQLSHSIDEAGNETASVDFGFIGIPTMQARVHREVDLAVVRIATGPALQHTLPLNNDLAPLEGDPVATCGWPYGLELDAAQWLSSFLIGTVSAVIPHPSLGPRHRQHYLMQLPVNPGNSGGPVFDPDTGDVYGVVSSRYEPRGIPAGLSVVVPSTYAAEPIREFLAEIAG